MLVYQRVFTDILHIIGTWGREKTARGMSGLSEAMGPPMGAPDTIRYHPEETTREATNNENALIQEVNSIVATCIAGLLELLHALKLHFQIQNGCFKGHTPVPHGKLKLAAGCIFCRFYFYPYLGR